MLTKVCCLSAFTKIKVTPIGDVLLCCFQAQAIGNLFKQSIEEIWHSPLAIEIRQCILSQKMHSMCLVTKLCPYIYNNMDPVYDIDVENCNLPTELVIDLPNTHCNIGGTEPTPETACFMCPRGIVPFTANPDMILEIIEKVRPLMPNLKIFNIQGIAEVFWKDRLFEIFDILDFAQYKHQIYFWTFSNATLFNEATQQRFLDAVDRSLLVFSIDGATPETYKKIRRHDRLQLVKDNISSYVKKIEGTRHKASITFNINTMNVHEIVQMVEMAHEFNVELLLFPTHSPTLNPATDQHVIDIMINKDNRHIFIQAEADARKRALELGVDLNIRRPLDIQVDS